MRPFFSYYGAKYFASKYLGKPRRNVIVEPFAGSACYSLRWGCPNVRLYDVSDDICDLWDFLINCSERDVLSIPEKFDHMDEVFSLPRGPQLLVRHWIGKGRAEPSNAISPWYMKHRLEDNCRVWGPPIRARVANQKPGISRWTIDKCSWESIPIIDAHYHVDPPYSGQPGRRYPHDAVDFAALSEWCRSLPGAVDVCENQGADWLPFEPLCDVRSMKGGTSKEVVWRKL